MLCHTPLVTVPFVRDIKNIQHWANIFNNLIKLVEKTQSGICCNTATETDKRNQMEICSKQPI